MANVQKELIDTYDGKGLAAEYAGYAERASKDENELQQNPIADMCMSPIGYQRTRRYRMLPVA